MTDSIYQSIPNPGLVADVILAIHGLVVVFVVGGQLLILLGWWRDWSWVRNLWFRVAHMVTIIIVVLQAWLGRLCPLTIWEQELRRAAGQVFYEQSFIEFWIGRYLYVDLPWWVFVLTYTVFALLVAWAWWKLPPRGRKIKGPPDGGP